MGRLFNGTSSRIVLSSDTLGIPATYAAWIYPRLSSTNGVICGSGTTTTGTLNYSVSGVYIVANKQDVSNLAISPPAVQISKWNHTAVSYDQVQAKIYLNGDLVATKSATDSINALAKGF